jgi:hypothetical protein
MTLGCKNLSPQINHLEMAAGKTLRDWYELKSAEKNSRNWHTASWKTRFRWVRQDVCTWIIEKPKTAWDNACTHGDYVASAHGISRLRQAIHQYYLAWRYDLPLDYYYLRELYRPDRWEDARHHIPRFWILQNEIRNQYSSNHSVLCDDKVEFYKHCQKNSIPSPKILTQIENGKIVLDKGNPERDIFIKLKEGAHGDGAEICKWDGKKYKTSHKKLLSYK